MPYRNIHVAPPTYRNIYVAPPYRNIHVAKIRTDHRKSRARPWSLPLTKGISILERHTSRQAVSALSGPVPGEHRQTGRNDEICGSVSPDREPSAEQLIPPARQIGSRRGCLLDALENFVHIHLVVAQARKMIRTLMIAIPAMLRTIAIIDLTIIIWIAGIF